MASIPTKVVGKPRSAVLRQLAGALAHVVRIGAPVALLTFVLCGLAYLGYLGDPQRTDVRKTVVDNMLTLEQFARATNPPGPDVAFIGDSSCLMGIHVPTLRILLPGLSVENYCTTARGGPASYAHLLDMMTAHGSVPNSVIVAIHPVQFRRDRSWDEHVASVLGDGIVVSDGRSMFGKALDYVRIEWLSHVLYSPLPGILGVHYGSEANLFRELRANGGSLLDATRGLAEGTRGDEASYAWNSEFEAALGSLARAIARFPHRRVFLVIMPVPAKDWSTRAGAERQRAAAALAQRLGIDGGNVITTEGSFPTGHFAVSTHLNRHGRILFSQSIAAQIATFARSERGKRSDVAR